jgi:hypothetical protein
MTLDELIAYLVAYRAAHPEHAGLAVRALAKGDHVIAQLSPALELRDELPNHGPVEPFLAFPDTDV